MSRGIADHLPAPGRLYKEIEREMEKTTALHRKMSEKQIKIVKESEEKIKKLTKKYTFLTGGNRRGGQRKKCMICMVLCNIHGKTLHFLVL